MLGVEAHWGLSGMGDVPLVAPKRGAQHQYLGLQLPRMWENRVGPRQWDLGKP